MRIISLLSLSNRPGLDDIFIHFDADVLLCQDRAGVLVIQGSFYKIVREPFGDLESEILDPGFLGGDAVIGINIGGIQKHIGDVFDDGPVFIGKNLSVYLAHHADLGAVVGGSQSHLEHQPALSGR